MRHHTSALCMSAILTLLTAVPASALVEPHGKVLPSYDIRRGGELNDGTFGSIDQSPGPAIAAHTPDATQAAAVTRLRRSGLSDLKVTWEPSNGMPRMLHAWGKPMTPSSPDDPVSIVRAFLHQNHELFRLAPTEIDDLVVLRDYGTHGVFHTVWLGQQYDGILVNHGAIRFNLDSEGRVVWASSGYLQPGLVVDTNAAVSPEEAVIHAARHIGIDLSVVPERLTPLSARLSVFSPGPFLSPVTARNLIFPLSNGRGVLSWEVLLEPRNGVTPAWYAVTIDADSGELLHRTNLYKYVTNAGMVFNGNYPEAAATHDAAYTRGVAQTTEDFGYRWQSTAGWSIPAPYTGTVGGFGGGQPQFWTLDYFTTNGNNVEAREDLAGDNQGDTPLPTAPELGYQPDGGPDQEWLFSWNDLYANSAMLTDGDRVTDATPDHDAIITNLFYWNNVWHDVMYGLGFDEVAGNFQFDNFSRGGCGTDAVQADAMDGALDVPASRNNANFATPPEPMPADCAAAAFLFRPRMQQFISRFGPEDAPTWLADTSLDADVIIHEFSHGTSHRLVGGPFVGGLDKHQSGSMGEGWGDWYAGNYFNDPVMGEYSFADPVAGVRNFAMDMNPRTYADVCDTQCQVHYNGEVWATCLWYMRQNVGRDVAFQLVTDGMKFSVVDPIMPEMRDGILIADQVRYAGNHICQIWDAFFSRDMGFDASSPDGAFPIPDSIFTGPTCSGWAHVRRDSSVFTDTDGDGLWAVGEPISMDLTLQNFDGASTATSVTATVVALTPQVTMTAATQSFPSIAAGATGASLVPFAFQTDPGFLCGDNIDFQVDISWTDVGGAHMRTEFFSSSGGFTDGPRLFWDDAEGAPSVMTGNTAVVTTQNHTVGGSQSYYTLDGCFAGTDLTCGGPCAASCNAIELPELELPTSRAAVVSFWATYNNEVPWDGIIVRISTDSGATWTELDSVDYNGTLAGHTVGCAPADGGAINGPPGNAALAPWTKFSGSLAAFVGQRVIIQIAQHMSNCNVFEGSYIDDIAVSVQHCTATPFIDTAVLSRSLSDTIDPLCTDSDDLPDPGETMEVDILIVNTGNSVGGNFTTTLSSTNPNISLLTPAAINHGAVSPGGTVNAVYRYTVLAGTTGCSEVADFNLAVTADVGYMAAYPFSDILRQDSPALSWFDTMEGIQPPWTPSLGPDGTQQDFALRSMTCVGSNNGMFWSTNMAMNPAACGSGEPDYGNDSDSVLTSPMIDLGTTNAQLVRMGWRGAPDAFGANWGGTVIPGFIEVSIDHDGDGIFTVLANWPNGINSVGWQQVLDIQNNPAAAAILASATQQFVQVRFRLRATGDDPDTGRSTDGLLVDDFWLEWLPCDLNLCTPGISSPGTGTLSTATGSVGHMTIHP